MKSRLGASDWSLSKLLLADLAEATAGIAVQTAGKADTLNVIAAADVSATRQRIARSLAASDSKLTPLQRFLKWCVLDQRSRTISQ